MAMKYTINIFFLFINFVGFTQESKENKLSQEQIKLFILEETKEGGKMDYFTSIAGKEFNAVQVKPGLFMTNIEMALYRWGKANFDLGIENVESALLIFEEFQGRELSRREKEIIPMGYKNVFIDQ